MPSHSSTALAHALQVASRTLVAAPGGYAAAALTASALARWLPGARADAVATGMLVSFAVCAAVVILAFAVSTATRAWAWTLAYCAPLALALYLSMHGTTP